MIIPKLVSKLRKLFPVHQVAVAVKFAIVDLVIVLVVYLLLLINLERLWPFLKFFIPVLCAVEQKVLLCVFENSLSSFRLLKPVVGLDQLLNCLTRVVVKFLLPVIKGLGVCITILSNFGQCTRREQLNIAIFIELHELSQVEDGLKHLVSVTWVQDCLLEVGHDLALIVVMHLAPATNEGDVVQLSSKGCVDFSKRTAGKEHRGRVLLKQLVGSFFEPVVPVLRDVALAGVELTQQVLDVYIVLVTIPRSLDVWEQRVRV
jgi:hypothetical protein